MDEKFAICGIFEGKNVDAVEPRYSAKNFWSLQQENLQN
jgi:hypothetical protein